jgi:hypothetical protein
MLVKQNHAFISAVFSYKVILSSRPAEPDPALPERFKKWIIRDPCIHINPGFRVPPSPKATEGRSILSIKECLQARPAQNDTNFKQILSILQPFTNLQRQAQRSFFGYEFFP